MSALLLALSLASSLSCRRSRPIDNPSADESDIVSFVLKVNEPELSRRVLREFSGSVGCEIVVDDGTDVIARCPEGVAIGVLPRNNQVHVACKHLALPQCQELWGKIVDEAIAASQKNGPPPAPPPASSGDSI